MTNKGFFVALVSVLTLVYVCQGQFLPRAPTDVLISDVTSDSLRLSWSPNPHSDGVLHYIIRYKPTATNQEFSEISGITANTYTMRGLNPYAEYEFHIVAVNSAGHGASSNSVVSPSLRSDPGSPPMNVQARPLGFSSIVIQWDPPKEFIGQILAYKVFYTEQFDLPIFKWHTQLVAINHLTTISGLAPRTVYAIMIQAITVHGRGSHSVPVQVKTQRGVPSHPPRIVVTSISYTSVELYWSKPAREGEKVIGYELYWNDSYTDEQFHRRLNDTDSYTIKGLYPDTLYNVWVAAKSEEGEGAPTPPIQVRTVQYVPSKPRRLVLRTINTTSIKVNWKHPQTKIRKGLVEGYRIYVHKVNDGTNSTTESNVYYVLDENSVEYNITDLEPSTNYSVQVAAVTRKTDGARTNEKTIRTAGGVPTRPKLTVILTPDDTHFIVEISWYRPVYINGNLKSYILIYGRSDLFEKDQMNSQELDPRTEKQIIQYLEYGAPYEFYLSARNDIGFGQEAKAVLYTPEAAPLAAPLNVTDRLQSPSSVVLSWLPPPLQYRNGEIIQYAVLLHKVMGESTVERKTSDTRIVLSGLEEGTNYIIRVRAYTSKGAGPWSNSLRVSTPPYVLPEPNHIAAYGTSEQSVEVSWTWDPSPYLVNALGFQVMYTTDPVEDLDQWEVEIVPFTFSVELTGLERYAIYAIRVAVITADGLGRLSSIELVKVDPTDIPTQLAAKDIGTDRLTLTWERPSKLEPVKYEISYDGYKEYYDEYGKLQKLSIPSRSAYVDHHITEYPVFELMPFTSYQFNITAVGANEGYRPAAKITVTTAMSAPKSMAKPGIVGLGGEASIILPKVSEEHGPISYYYIVVVPEDYAARDPGEYLTGELGAVPTDKIGPYIAAKFLYGNMPERFPLGDGEKYGSFMNRRLHHDEKYRVFTRAVVDSPLMNLYSSSSLSDLISWDLTAAPEEVMIIDYGYSIPGYESSDRCEAGGISISCSSWIVLITPVVIFVS